MEGQTTRSKNQRNSPIKVRTNWHQTQEHSPAFKRLMMMLLYPVEDRHGKEEDRKYR